MTETPICARAAVRITIGIHHHFLKELFAALAAAGVRSVIVESGRSVRELRTRRPLGLPGFVVRMDNNPLDLVTCTVGRDHAEPLLRFLVEKTRLDIPGRGSVFCQEVIEHSSKDLPEITIPEDTGNRVHLLPDLSLITIILSLPGSGNAMARIALDLGTGVPMVSLGAGTGLRDRLGLLRITIPAEKELVQLLVPAHDARGLVNQIIEEGRLDHPGRGFVYASPVTCGVLDTRLRIGPQQHPATMEQIIAAIDQLTAGTGWRKRFSPRGSGTMDRHVQKEMREISFLCPEGTTDLYLDHALKAGAGGATTCRVQRLALHSPEDGGAAWERCILTLSVARGDAVVEALLQAEIREEGMISRIQVLPVDIAFSHGW